MNPIFSYNFLFPIICITYLLIREGIRLSKDGLRRKSSFNINTADLLFLVSVLFYILNKLLLSSTKTTIFDCQELISVTSLYILLRMLSQTDDGLRIRKIIPLLLVLGAYECILAFAQVFNNETAIGSFGNRAVLANFLATIFPFILWELITLIKEKSKLSRIVIYFIFTILFGILVFYYLYSRTAALSIICIVIAIIILETSAAKKIKSGRRRLIFVFFSFVFCLNVAAATIFIKNDSTSGRWFVIKRQLEIVEDNFICGIGFGNFEKEYNAQQAHYFQYNDYTGQESYLASYISVNYNEFLNVIVQGGLGALLLIICWTALLVSLISTASKDKMIYAYSLLSFFILAMFSYPTETLVIFCISIFSLVGISSENAKTLAIIRNPYKSFNLLVLLFSIISATTLCMRYNALLKWHVIRQQIKKEQKDTAEIRMSYDELIPQLNNDPVVLVDYSRNLIQQNRLDESLVHLKIASNYSSKHTIFTLLGEVYEELGSMEEAVYYFKTSSFLVPNLFYSKYRLMQLYKNQGLTDECLEVANSIMNQPVKVNSKIVQEIKKNAAENINKIGSSQ